MMHHASTTATGLYRVPSTASTKRFAAMDTPPELIAGEQVACHIINAGLINNGDVQYEMGHIWVTNFRTYVRFYETGEFAINHGNVIRIEKGGILIGKTTYEVYTIFCRDMAIETIGIPTMDKLKKEFFKNLQKFCFPKQFKKIFCFSHTSKGSLAGAGWEILDIEKEFTRQGINMKNWRVSQANKGYDLCKTFPQLLVVPNQIADPDLFNIGQFRTIGRIQVLSWGNASGALLLRAGRLNPCHDDMTGLANVQKSPKDEAYMKAVLGITGKDKMTIVEMESKNEIDQTLYAAFYQERANFKYCAFPPGTPRTNFADIYQVCTTASIDNFYDFFESVDKSGWTELLSKFLQQTCGVVSSLLEGYPVVLQNDAGDGMVAVMSAIAQLLLDPYYRTIEGFAVLVEKEFMYYGFKFCTFFGQRRKEDEHASNFILFIDCAWQVYQQFPFSFEWTEKFLLFMMDASYSCQFGNFVTSCERERLDVKRQTVSVWEYVFDHAKDFSSPYYTPREGPLNFIPDKNRIRLWSGFYLRYKCRNSISKAERAISTAANKKVKALELTSMKIPSFPSDDFTALTSVTNLNLNRNMLNKLPFGLLGIHNLRVLSIEENQIPFVAEDYLRLLVTQVPNLEELNLGNNQLVEFHELFCSFQKLRTLRLNSNLIKELPPLTGFPELLELDISGNLIQSIPNEIFQMTKLVELNIGGNAFGQIPNSLASLVNLTILDISNSGIVSVPANLAQLTQLKHFNISRNEIREILPPIFAFTNLETLNLEGTQISEIPPTIAKFPNLTNLNLGSNLISVIPPELLELRKLRILNLASNVLVTIPLDISALDNLEELYLSRNKLECLTPGVGKLVNLRVLDVSFNYLQFLPAAIGYLEKLRKSGHFKFSNNKLSQIPKEVLDQGYEPLFYHLQDLLEGSEASYRMKIMLVGQENVGKTSLYNALKDYQKQKFKNSASADTQLRQVSGKTVSTDGIDIGSLKLRVKQPNEDSSAKAKYITINLSVWDFAGQEIYYTTHQFFLSDRALYILVWNIACPEEESRVEYWLKSIKARTQNAPILIVATHTDDPICTKEYIENATLAVQNKYCPQYPNIQRILPVSTLAEHEQGIADTYLWIQAVVCQQPFMGERNPKTYLELEKLVVEESKKRVPPVVSWDQFAGFGEISNIRTKERLLVAAAWLHNLGAIVHFQKEKGLEDIVILDPQWLTDVMSSIITTKHYFVKNGVLDHSSLPNLWKDHSKFPPHLHRVLLNLLEKFEISYYLRSTQQVPIDGNMDNMIYTGKSLVPSLLPEDRPSKLDEVWAHFPAPNERQCSRRYVFGFIPHGFISRLMVRLLFFAEPTIFWRHGMLVDSTAQNKRIEDIDGEFQILIEAQPAHKLLDITIRGTAGEKLAQLFIETLNALIDGWYTLTVDVLVPCTHCIRSKDYNPYMFPIESCEQACIEGKSFVKCSGIRDIRLDELVPDIAMTHVQNCKLSYAELNIREKIGQGGFATVFKGTYEGKSVAIKKIEFGTNLQASLSDVTEIQAFSEFRREVWIMSGLIHRNTVLMAGFTMDPFCIVTEFVPCGNLYELIHSNTELSWNYRWRVAMDIAKGMHFLHFTTWPPIIHRDLKSPNVLLSSLDPSAEVVAKVADFGLSQALSSTTHGRSVANPVWLAPEIMKNEEYTEKADVYSFGVILWELGSRADFFGHLKFMSALENSIIEGERPQIGKDVPEEFASLIKRCWDGDPDKRPAFTEIVQVLSRAIKKYVPQLYDVAVADKEIEAMRRPKNADSQVKKKRTAEEIENERKELEAARKRVAAMEMEGITSRLEPALPASIQCMLYVPASLTMTVSQVWVGTSDGAITIWNTNGTRIETINAHSSQIFVMILVNDTIWTSSSDGIKIYLARTAKLKKEIKIAKEPLICLHRVGKTVWAGSTDGWVHVFDIKGMKAKKKFRVIECGPVYSMLCLETLQLVWIGTDQPDRSIVVYSTKYKLISENQTGHSKKVTGIIEIKGMIWTCSADRTIKIWNPENGECVRLLQGHTGPIYALNYCGSHVWSGSWDKTVILWDASYQSFYKEFEPHGDAVSCIVHVPDTKAIWTGSFDRTILCWHTAP